MKSDIENLKSWQENLPDQVEVQLLIVDEFENEEAKNEINQWAIQNGVEIIDFSEDQDLDSEEQVEIFAKNSQKRCVESLQTVIWTQFATEQDESCKEESEMEDFENLFANLVHFKETATGLPDEERRKFAEKVALSFYSALGEDDD